jgi:Gpi18-like mannosyltransferase
VSPKLSLCIAFISLIVAALLWTQTTIPIDNVTIYRENRPELSEPARNSEDQPFAADATFDYRAYRSAIIRANFAGCLKNIALNGKDLPLENTKINRTPCVNKTITLDLSPYLEPGINQLELRLGKKSRGYETYFTNLHSIPVIAICALLVLFLPLTLWIHHASLRIDVRPFLRRLYDRWLMVLGFCGLAIAMRVFLFPIESNDFRAFLAYWLNYLQNNDLRTAYGDAFTNYAPFYTYMLGIGDRLFGELGKLYTVKIISNIADLLAAFWMYRIVALHYHNDREATSPMPLLAAMLTLVLPSAVINSSGGGQCDMWWVQFLLGAMYYVMAGKPNRALVCAGLAYSFKLQAILLAPFLLICLLRRLVAWSSLWIVPVVFIVTCIPAWAEGRELWDMAMVYWHQFHTYDSITETGNLYYALRGFDYITMRNVAIILTTLVSITLVVVTKLRWRAPPTVTSYMLLATLVAGLMPYILPKIINRYFLLADMMTLALACIRPRWWPIAVLFQIASVLTFQGWQFGLIRDVTHLSDHVRFPIAAVLYALALAMLLALCCRHVWKISRCRWCVFNVNFARKIAIFLCVVIMSFAIKLQFIDYKSGDYTKYLGAWITHIRQAGLLNAYADNFSDYSLLYLYFLGIGDALLPTGNMLYTVKIITFMGEFFAAYWIYRIVALYYDNARSLMPFMLSLLVLITPSVIANGAIMAQCDIWYTAFLLGAMYYIFARRPNMALLYGGLAFSFKLQAILLAPFLLVCLLRRTIPWGKIWIIPAVYVVTCIPAWIEGRPLTELLSIYFSGYQEKLIGISWNAANFYIFSDGYDYTLIDRLGVTAAAISTLFMVYLTYRRGAAAVTPVGGMLLATLFAGWLPMLLPGMHDRYFFVADIFSLVLACLRPSWWPITALFQAASLLAPPPYQLPQVQRFTGWSQQERLLYGFELNIIAIVMLLWLCGRYIWKSPSLPQKSRV